MSLFWIQSIEYIWFIGNESFASVHAQEHNFFFFFLPRRVWHSCFFSYFIFIFLSKCEISKTEKPKTKQKTRDRTKNKKSTSLETNKTCKNFLSPFWCNDNKGRMQIENVKKNSLQSLCVFGYMNVPTLRFSNRHHDDAHQSTIITTDLYRKEQKKNIFFF